MRATELIADILGVGVLALAWCTILFCVAAPQPAARVGTVVAHYAWNSDLTSVAGAVGGVVATALAYAAGVVVDRLADSLLYPLEPTRADAFEASPIKTEND